MPEGGVAANGGKEVGAGRGAASESDNDTVGEDRPREYTHVKAPPPREDAREQADGGTGDSQAQDKKAEVLSPTEKKRRRLESNRAAAKRAYYRRQNKTESIQQENSLLRSQLATERFKVAIFRNLLRRLGVDPEVALAAITGHTAPAASLPAAAAVQIQSQQHSAGSLCLGAEYLPTASLNVSGAAAGLPVSGSTSGSSDGVATEEPAAKQGAPTAAGPPV